MPQSTPRRRAQRSGPIPEKSKTALACLSCRRKKVKCSGTIPCDYCSKRGIDCNRLEPGQRRFYSVQKIQDLESRLAELEGQDNQDNQDHPPSPSPSQPRLSSIGVPIPPSLSDRSSVSISNAGTHTHDGSPQARIPRSLTADGSPSQVLRSNAAKETSPAPTIVADATLSSTNNFGSRVVELLVPPPDRPGPQTRRNPIPLSTPHEANSRPCTQSIPTLPTEVAARHLVDAVNFYVGQTQSLYDSRALLDRLEAFYATPDDDSHARALWFLQLMIIFALGKLLLGEFDDGEDPDGPPGMKIFGFAMRNLPALGEQYDQGRLGVETFALVALYLQNVDRHGEAYVYTSTALRLAIAHGFHRRTGVQHLLSSERMQLNRLWWTVYMQERRLAAATGNPCGISDDSINLDLPFDSPGFGPAAPLRLNVKIAQVTSRILNVLYGAKSRTEEDFISTVQDIIQSLYTISREIPSELATDVHGPGPDQPIRTSASLQLMLLQATLLTIRPIMLHVAKLILANDLRGGETLVASSLGKLSRICSEAARRLLDVVMALKNRRILAIFGFFDCDATFSAAFVMILTAIFDSSCRSEQQIDPSPGLDDALEVLQYLASRGNRFAVQRLEEVQKVWKHVAPYLEGRASKSKAPRQSEAPEVPEEGTASEVTGMESVVGLEEIPAPPEQQPTELWNDAGAEDADPLGSRWYSESIGQAEGGFGGTLGMAFGGSHQAVLPSALWDDLSLLWHPLGEFNEGVFNEGQVTGSGNEESHISFEAFLSRML